MILSADELFSYLRIHDVEGKKTQIGYDLTLKYVNRIKGGVVNRDETIINDYEPVFQVKARSQYRLTPGVYALTFDQGIKVPAWATAFIRHRSSVARAGGLITSGVYDAGFETEYCGAILLLPFSELVIERHARVAQIYMVENKEEVKEENLYNGQWQGHKDYK